MVTAAPLADLAIIDRSLLHVFVAGPGYGEGIAVALPERGWLVVDSCRSVPRDDAEDDLSLQALIERFRGPDDPIRMMLLTHPHEDHADGFGEMVTELQPEALGLASPPDIASSYHALVASAAPPPLVDTERERHRRQVEAACRAMRAWEDRHGRPLTPLHDGATWTFGEAVTLSVRAPSVSLLERRLKHATWPELRSGANELSVVLEVTFGATRIVLGGDLPETRDDRPVEEGWTAVLDRHAHLACHHGLKIPHHGSREALVDALLASPGERAWWVTPYSRSKLPRGGTDEGMARLLAHHQPIQVTALPTRRAEQVHVPPPGVLTATQWDDCFRCDDLPGTFARLAIEVGAAAGAGPMDPVWCAAFDREGRCVRRWRGAVAVDVVPSTP